MTKDKKEDTNAIKFPDKKKETATSNLIEDKPLEEVKETEEESYGSSSNALGAIMALGSVAIVLMLIIIIVGNVESMVPSISNASVTTANTTISATEIFGVLQLAPIVMIVIVAGIVIGILAVFSRS